MSTNAPDSRTTPALVGLCGDGDQAAVAADLLERGCVVLTQLRFPREAWEVQWRGGEVWQVGAMHDWPVDVDMVLTRP